jgi:hypothetical protein
MGNLKRTRPRANASVCRAGEAAGLKRVKVDSRGAL